MAKNRRDPHPEEYRGIYMRNYEDEEYRKSKWTHKIFIFNPVKHADVSEEYLNKKLNQVVHIEDHSIYDFEWNAKKIIRHFKRSYGNVSQGIFTLGQSILFTVYNKQKEPFELSLFAFLVNYVSMIPLIEVGAPMNHWTPWRPQRFTVKGWENLINDYIYMCRPYANMRKICEGIMMAKYLMNMWCADAGDRLGLSFDLYQFIQVMERSKDVYENITCSFPIPEDITPTELEEYTTDRTRKMIKFIGEQNDLSIGVFARNGLFNEGQMREFATHMTFKPTLDGSTLSIAANTNVMMGIKDALSAVVDAVGGRKAEMAKLKVSDAGTTERALMMALGPMRWVDINYECDSRHFRIKELKTVGDLYNVEGRVFTLDPDGDEFYIMEPRTMTNLIGQTIYLKTPITCTHPRRREGYICSACYGKLLGNLNRDIHIGKVAAADSSANMEQVQLGAKHLLRTDTVPVEFPEEFDQYFTLGNGSINLCNDMINMSMENEEEFNHLFLEFYPSAMGKRKDGESRRYDRSFTEIVIFNDLTQERISIAENNGLKIYLSPEFNDELFLPAMHYRDEDENLLIPFSSLCENGKVLISPIFEFTYKNNELSAPLAMLDSLMFNISAMSTFTDYDQAFNTFTPLFIKGGIHAPDYQMELLISAMIYNPDNPLEPVDWTEEHPNYKFTSIHKALTDNPNPLTSILYSASALQIAGADRTYEKSGALDGYPWYLLEHAGSNETDTDQ